MLARLACVIRWGAYIMAGAPAPEPKPCEFRRPASITCYRHGERKRPANRSVA